MTIIVTGGAGFIGSNFIYHMLKKYPDYRIVCVDCLTYAGNLSTLEEAMKNPNFRFSRTNICDRANIYRLFEEEKPDIVVNFAAESHVDRSIENPEVFLQTNILGTQVMMDACRKYGIAGQKSTLTPLLSALSLMEIVWLESWLTERNCMPIWWWMPADSTPLSEPKFPQNSGCPQRQERAEL